MKATACCIALSSLLLSACATTPRVDHAGPASASGPAPIDTTYLPRLRLPGANIAEVRALALGAARSRGWTVKHVDVANGRLVVERPADTVPGVAAVPGATLEVTTLLKDDGTGVEVAILAELVTPAYAGQPEARIDYTDPLRDLLMQSLDSLRERWIRDRERLSRATPPAGGWQDAWKDPNTPPTHRPILEEGNSPQTVHSAPPVPPAPTYTPRPSTQSVADTRLGPDSRSMPAPGTTAIPHPTYTRRPTPPEPRPSAPGAAPMADASLSPNPVPAPKPTSGLGQAVTARDDMMSPPRPDPAPQATAGPWRIWSANAEQYARQRGCQITGSGSQLIEVRQDGEVYKVPCQGSDSFLIHCQDGFCRGLL
ncbi:MAG: hypothetical protein ACUVQI_00240 [Thermochromatium sp.]